MLTAYHSTRIAVRSGQIIAVTVKNLEITLQFQKHLVDVGNQIYNVMKKKITQKHLTRQQTTGSRLERSEESLALAQDLERISKNL